MGGLFNSKAMFIQQNYNNIGDKTFANALNEEHIKPKSKKKKKKVNSIAEMVKFLEG